MLWHFYYLHRRARYSQSLSHLRSPHWVAIRFATPSVEKMACSSLPPFCSQFCLTLPPFYQLFALPFLWASEYTSLPVSCPTHPSLVLLPLQTDFQETVFMLFLLMFGLLNFLSAFILDRLSKNAYHPHPLSTGYPPHSHP